MTFKFNLSRLFNPKSIAVIGGHFADAVIQQCIKMGYKGKIWPINLNKSHLSGYKCYKSVDALPAVPDAAFIGVNRHQSIEIVNQLSAIKCGGAICYASGFKESGDDKLNQQLIQAADDMPILGPNCYGYINYLDNVLLWPDQHGAKSVANGVAIIMQSSNMAINVSMNKRALPISYLITLGNQALVGLSDVIQHLCLDDRVTAIGLHIEGIDDLSKFAKAINTAQQFKKPVVILKSGRSEKGAQITLTHTASLSSVDRVMSALYQRLGVAQCESISVFLEALKIGHIHGYLPGNDMVSLSCSGGEASMMSDLSDASTISFPDFSDEEKSKVKSTVNPLVSVSNPFDYHTFDWANYEKLKATFTAVMEAKIDLAVLIMDFPRQDRCKIDDWLISLKAWKDAAQGTKSKTAIIASLCECMPESIGFHLLENDIVPLCGLDEAVNAIESMMMVNKRQQSHYEPLSLPAKTTTISINLDEFKSKRELQKFNLTIPDSSLCTSYEQVLSFVEDRGFPVVLKAVKDDLLHKTERDAIRLNITTVNELEQAFLQLSKLSDSVLIESMVEDIAYEMIVGVNYDVVVGYYLLIGAGGIFAELIKDNQILMLPCDEKQIIEAIDNTKIAKLLNGYRGRKKINTNQLVETILNIQKFVISRQDSLIDMDINPLIIKNDGACVVADALIRLNSHTHLET